MPASPPDPQDTSAQQALRAEIARLVAACSGDPLRSDAAVDSLLGVFDAAIGEQVAQRQRAEVELQFARRRASLEPHLVHLICGLRSHQITEAMRLLLDYIDAGRGGQAAPAAPEVAP